MPSSLVLRFSYNGYWDVFYWALTRFNASVVDIETGDVVVSVQFDGDRRASGVLREFVSQIAALRL